MLRLWVLLLGETGLRSLSEALHLEWSDVDLAGGFLHVRSAPGRRTKSGRSRWVPLTDRLRDALQDHAARHRLKTYGGRRSPYLFHQVTGKAARHGERIKSLRKAFDNAVRRAGLPAELRVHDLRHARATSWLAEGRNAVHVKEALGHADLATTMRYTHLLPVHLRALVSDIPSHHTAPDVAKSVAKRAKKA
jgi:integrase